MEVKVHTTSARQKGRAHNWRESDANLDTKLAISVKKKNDLIRLCAKDIIPEEFHGYSTALAVRKSQKDRVPVDSSDEDTDAE